MLGWSFRPLGVTSHGPLAPDDCRMEELPSWGSADWSRPIGPQGSLLYRRVKKPVSMVDVYRNDARRCRVPDGIEGLVARLL